MKTIKVSRNHYHVVQALTRKDVAILRKSPKILAESKQLLRACKSVIKKIEGIPEHASRRKRQTAYKRIIGICRKAIDQCDH
jgi:5-bromo-4-chloroindolyl phosphate hydrolysis protein